MRQRAVAVAGLLAAMSVGVIDASAADEAELIAKGHALLEANCARCHAIGATGESKHKDAPPFRVVVSRYPPENLAEALAEGLISGHPDMPEFVFEPDEVGAITTYLGSLTPEPDKPK